MRWRVDALPKIVVLCGALALTVTACGSGTRSQVRTPLGAAAQAVSLHRYRLSFTSSDGTAIGGLYDSQRRVGTFSGRDRTGPCEQINLGNDAYLLATCDLVASDNPIKRWVKVPATDAEVTGLDGGEAEVNSLIGTTTVDSKEIAVESINGVRATHYRETSGPKRLDVWIDQHGKVLQLAVSVPGVLITMSDFGAIVAPVAAPSADQVQVGSQ